VGLIPESFIQEVLARVDIIDIVKAAGIPIKKTGANYLACCPFHHEKTPSFSVNQSKQFYHCFGCGVHGDAISFLKEMQGLSFTQAIEQLATPLGLAIPLSKEEEQQQTVQQQWYQLMAQVMDYYQVQLKTHAKASHVIDYLKNRGLTGEIAKEYGLGFAPPGWDNVLTTFGKSSQEKEALSALGLLIKNEQQKLWDRFRNRIMFPIRDAKGRVLGFGARVIETDSKEPKYLNSPETVLFHKSTCLFGLYELLKRTRCVSSAIIVEGYMDVIALAQQDIGALATLGTAVTEQHLKKLFRYTSNVTFCFDGDSAGRGAANKAMHLLLPFMQDGYEIRFVFLPEGYDPDTYIRKKGSTAFKALLSNGIPFSEYFFEVLMQQVTPSTIDSKAKLVKMAKALLVQLPNGVFREMMFHRLSEIVSVRPSIVNSGIGIDSKIRYQEKKDKGMYRGSRGYGWNVQKMGTPLVGKHSLPPATLAALLLIREPTLVELLPEKIPFELINAQGIKLLAETLNLLRENPNLNSELLMEGLAAKDIRWKNLPLNNPAVEFLPPQGRQQAFLDTTRYLISFASKQMSQTLLEASKVRELSEQEKAQLKRLLISANGAIE